MECALCRHRMRFLREEMRGRKRYEVYYCPYCGHHQEYCVA